MPDDFLASFLPAIILLAALWLLSFWLSRRAGPRASARRILDMQKKVYSGRHEHQLVSASDFPELDLTYYQTMQAWFEARRFRHMADLQNLTLARTMPWARACIRSMLSDDGTIAVEFYDVKFRGWLRLLQLLRVMPRDLRSIGLMSELTDGTFIGTSNTLCVDTTTPPPEMIKYRHPRETPPEQLLQYHQDTTSLALSQRPGTSLVSYSTLDDILDAENRVQDLKNAYYQSIGYMNEQELVAIANTRNVHSAHQVAREIEAAKSEPRNR